jgi:hypothetical protein
MGVHIQILVIYEDTNFSDKHLAQVFSIDSETGGNILFQKVIIHVSRYNNPEDCLCRIVYLMVVPLPPGEKPTCSINK